MRYDRDFGYAGRERYRGGESDLLGRGEHGAAYEAPFRGRAGSRPAYGRDYFGGVQRSRGSYQAGQLRSGLNPRDEFEFGWGEGYVGGRGYGGTNYDYEHGYSTAPAGPALYGPARYGYGPYHERLRRQNRADDEIREDVEEAFFYDTWIDAERITVQVDDGVVTLRGTLPNYDEVRYATDDAWDVDGVRGVRSELQVRERSATERLGQLDESSAGGANAAEAWTQGAPTAATDGAGAAQAGAIAGAAEEPTDHPGEQAGP